MEPEEIGFRIELLPAVLVLLLHHPVDVELVVAATVSTQCLEEAGVLCQVVVDRAPVHTTGEPRQREVDYCNLNAARIDGVGVAIQCVVDSFSARLLIIRKASINVK